LCNANRTAVRVAVEEEVGKALHWWLGGFKLKLSYAAGQMHFYVAGELCSPFVQRTWDMHFAFA